jgi:hypothetical protein
MWRVRMKRDMGMREIRWTERRDEDGDGYRECDLDIMGQR